MSKTNLARLTHRLEHFEERLRRARAELLDLEGEVTLLRRELGEVPSSESEPRTPSAGKRLMTVRQFAERHPAFTESSLRWIRYRSQPVTRLLRGGREQVVPEIETNGFETAFVKIGWRVFVDEAEFFRCVERQRGK